MFPSKLSPRKRILLPQERFPFSSGDRVLQFSETDFSIVIEKMTHDDSSCARGRNSPYNTSAENMTMVLGGSLLATAKVCGYVWVDPILP